MEPAQGASTDRTAASSSALRKWGPVGALAIVAVVVIGIIAFGGGDDDDEPTATATETPDAGEPADEPAPADEPTADEPSEEPADEPVEDPGPDTGLPPGVIPFSVAQDLGLDDIDWGPRCDPEAGLLAVPSFFRPECFAPFDGDNGGATAPGVTEDTIRIVYWSAQQSDPVLNYLTDAIVNDDTNADVEDTLNELIAYHEAYWETYGRSVELIFFEGSGLILDAVSARADAVQIAEELDPFMVWGGPTLTNAFAEELAARGIPCLSCGPGQERDFYVESDPYIWAIGMGPEQSNLMRAEFVAKQLAGRPAIHAGDEAMHTQERVLARLWIESSAASVELNEHFEQQLAGFDIELAESISYVLDPGTIQETAATVIARLKAAGVTTILLSGDPVAPRDFTREATDQGYFPEWILGGSVLTDTNVFARTYDQEQWQNAFGITTLGARVNPEISSTTFIYEWFHGEPPAADDTIGVLSPLPLTFYNIIQSIGPELTIENWRQVIFDAEPTRRAITNPSVAWGESARWPADLEPDWFGVDDMTVVWWDPDEIGVDELKREGPGMYQYADMGTRYLLGEWPDAEPNVFDPETSIAVFEDRPADEPVPIYDPLPGG